MNRISREVLPARRNPLSEASAVARGMLVIAVIFMGLSGLSQLVRLIAETW